MKSSVMSRIRAFAHACLLIGLALATATSAAAQSQIAYPNKPLRLIVPGGPGGSLDARVRWFAPRLSTRLGQPIAIENKVGAGGNVGTEAGAQANPDGYTLVAIHIGTMAMNPYLYDRVAFDPLKDFIPIARISSNPMVLSVHAGLSVHSVAELIKAATARPGDLNFASPGFGTPPHMAGELFKRRVAINVKHIPYKSGGQSIQDVIAGHVQFMLEGPAPTLPHINNGKLRALAVTGAKRLPSLPDVPTLAEVGVPEAEFYAWTGFAVPTGTPKEIAARLHRETLKILESAEGREYAATTGSDWQRESLEAFARSIRDENALWRRVIRDPGLKAE